MTLCRLLAPLLALAAAGPAQTPPLTPDIPAKFEAPTAAADFVMNRPARGPLKPGGVDHSTDAWDMIEWLVNSLYDRNPQTYVDSIFFAQPADYVRATQRICRSGDQASFIELPVAPRK